MWVIPAGVLLQEGVLYYQGIMLIVQKAEDGVMRVKKKEESKHSSDEDEEMDDEGRLAKCIMFTFILIFSPLWKIP